MPCLKAALSVNHAYFLEGISLGGLLREEEGVKSPTPPLGTDIC